ncbi:ribonuclease III [Akkermansiaceae bacterium]|nr:ribonuclease III [Akkermansiaceae bacterium]
MTALQETLSYTFSDEQLLKEALSHPSLSSEMRPAPPDNQRLEYLGDAVIELITSDYLYRTFPNCQEGLLTKLRASIVSKTGLAQVARRLKIGESLMFSRGEESSGGRERASNLADALEAIIGAIYLDAGHDRARELVVGIFEPELLALDPESAQASNSKGTLQEILQQIAPESPNYEMVSEEGPPHDRTFTSKVTWCGKTLGSGTGASKKVSEIAAAVVALETRGWD